MNAMYKPNISSTGRWASTVMGAALATVAYKQSNKALGLAGLGLLARGATGFCPVNAAIGRDTSAHDTRRALGGSRGVTVESWITIERPRQEVYAYWRSFENLPTFMSHLVEVRDIDGERSHWVAKGPLGINLEWDAEIINDIPSELIAWKTVCRADVISAGSVRFRSVPEGTALRVRLQYAPPAGKVGATVAWMLGEDADLAIQDDLFRFKQLIETGAAPVGAREIRSRLSRTPQVVDSGI